MDIYTFWEWVGYSCQWLAILYVVVVALTVTLLLAFRTVDKILEKM